MTGVLPRLRPNRLTLLGAGVVFLFAAIALWSLRSSGPDPRLEAIRKKGYPANLAELDAWYPRVPDTGNVALVYTRIFASPLFTNQPSPIDSVAGSIRLPPRGQTLAPEDQTEVAALLAKNERLLQPLYSTAGASRYPLDLKQGLDLTLPHLSRCKSAVTLLAAAGLLHAGEGQSERALQDLAAAGRIADSLSEEPVLVSQLVRFASWSLLVSHLERVVNLSSLDEPQLLRLQAWVEAAEKPQCLARAMAGEQAGGAAAFSNPKTLLNFTMNLSSPPRLSERLWRVAMVDALKASGFFARDKTFYLGAMATNVATAELPFPGRVQGGLQAAALIPPNRLYLFSHLLLPALSKAFTRDADACARLRAAQAALAIERFRLAHTNALPQSLAELVPAYLKSVPADPYDGHPLRFKPRKAGYVVYSIGRDGKDDGGLEFKLMNASGPHDLTFILDK